MLQACHTWPILLLCLAAVAGAGSRAASRSGSTCTQQSSQVEADFRLLQELLRRDYAVGYIMLSWLLRCTWTITPAIALLLKLPQPAMLFASKQHLPALLAWLLSSTDRSQSPQQHQEQVAQQLSPEKLKELQEQLLGPTAAVATYAAFDRTCRMLAGAPVTAQQVSRAVAGAASM